MTMAPETPAGRPRVGADRSAPACWPLPGVVGSSTLEWLLVAFGTCWVSLAAAQTDADAPKVDPKFEAHEDKARREAAKVFNWIRIHSEAPKRPAQSPADGGKATAALPKAPVAPAASERPKATPAPAQAARPPGPVALPSVPAPAPAQRPRTAAVPAAPDTAPAPAAAASVAPVAAPTVSPSADEQAGSPPFPGTAASGAEQTADLVDDAPLVLVTSVEPEFPGVLTRRLRKGWVQVRLEVDTDGRVTEAEIAGSSHPRLNEPALAAVRRWVFRPPGQARQATAEIAFDLDGQ